MSLINMNSLSNNKTMLTRLIAIASLVLTPVVSMAAGGGSSVKMEPIEVRLGDLPSMQNGARIFVNYCLSCHNAEYMRYNRMAEDLEIPAALVESQMISSDAKIGDPMTTNMPADKAAEWFGVTPPDLSLTGRLRGPRWLYNYFKGFYVDENSVSGWNNTVFPGVAMPHVLAGLQGRQRAVFKEVDGHQEFGHFELEREGSMSPEEFDSAMRDLTNFLVYMGEPAKLHRIKYGMYVMLFLLVFFGLAFMLKHEYWRDVDKSH